MELFTFRLLDRVQEVQYRVQVENLKKSLLKQKLLLLTLKDQFQPCLKVLMIQMFLFMKSKAQVMISCQLYSTDLLWMFGSKQMIKNLYQWLDDLLEKRVYCVVSTNNHFKHALYRTVMTILLFPSLEILLFFYHQFFSIFLKVQVVVLLWQLAFRLRRTWKMDKKLQLFYQIVSEIILLNLFLINGWKLVIFNLQ